MFQESLLYTSIPLRHNVSARINMRGLRRSILIDTLRWGHNVGFLVERINHAFAGKDYSAHLFVYLHRNVPLKQSYQIGLNDRSQRNSWAPAGGVLLVFYTL